MKLEVVPERSFIDVCRVLLPRPLAPGNSIVLTTPFHVKIPSGTISRLGHVGQAYAITQWYPKPAVYDHKGWHPMPYLNQGEFFSEYGSFEVSITLPANYVVGATGDLQTESELKWLEEKSTAPVDTSGDMSFPASATEWKTLVFKQSKIHDFAWFADKRFHVRRGEVELPYSKRKVTTWSMFTNKEARLWMRAPEYLHDAIYWYSTWVGEYPYAQCTAIDGTISAGGGMEYPNVTIIGSTGRAFPLEIVIAHEVGHNWFYGILGNDERTHPWMDEGINSYYEMRYVLNKYPPVKYGNKNEFASGTGKLEKSLGLTLMDYRQSSRFMYLASATSHTEQALGLPAAEFSPTNYGTIVYKKGALSMDYLADYLGQEVFDSSMHTYFKEWGFRHPYPDDMRLVFEGVSGKNLGWFFEDLLNSEKGFDASIHQVKKKDNGFTFRVRANSKKLPVKVTAFSGKTAMSSTWLFPADSTFTIQCTTCDHLRLDAENRSPDMYPRNNDSRWNTPRISLLPGVHHPEKGTIFITPVGGWNAYNGWMGGIIVGNYGAPFRKVDFQANPLFGFKDKSICGTAALEGIQPVKNKFIDRLQWTQQLRHFAFDRWTPDVAEDPDKIQTLRYTRYSPSITLYIKTGSPSSTTRNTLQLSSVHLWEDQPIPTKDRNPDEDAVRLEYRDFYRLRFETINNKAIDPWKTLFVLEANRDIMKAEGELKYRFSYKKPGKSLSVRLYGGYMMKDLARGAYSFNLSDRTGVSGSSDYAYDEWYFGRSEKEGLLSRQAALRQGAFKAYNPYGAFKDWIVSMNLSSHIPGPFKFIKIYADLGTTEGLKKDIRTVYDYDVNFSYNAGIEISLIRDAFEIYLPLLYSKEIKEYYSFKEYSLTDRIRFVFDLNKLRLAEIRSSFL